MKKVILLTILFMLSVGLMAQPQYYNFNNVGTSSNTFPLGQAAGKASQWLFLPGAFNQPAPLPPGNNITDVYIFITTGGSRTYTDFLILMAQDTITALTTGTFYPPASMDTVYYRASVTLSAGSTAWLGPIELDTPFPYDPTKSLIVMVGQCAGAGSGMYVRQNVLPYTGRVWSVGGCPFVPYAGGDGSIVNFGMDVESGVQTYQVPDLLYYKFENNGAGVTPNYATPGVGTNPAPFTGSISSGGQFDSAFVGTGTSGAGVTPGWSLNVGTSSWTISMWLSIPTTSSGSAYYLFGDPGAASFRCFHNGVALANNLILRGGGMPDLTVTGIGPTPTVVHFVYDSAAVVVKAYKNGAFFGQVTPTSPLNLNGTGFRTAGYSTSTNLVGLMDEFRFYKRALDTAEISATWNQELPFTVTGIKNIAEVPENFKLYQNYPNPFNPATKIKYSIPKSGLVKMIVFDILGREVATLINGNMTAGTYEITFDASKLSSGMYFYRLESNGAVDTKKMMFIK